jgi:hypothetical protein
VARDDLTKRTLDCGSVMRAAQDDRTLCAESRPLAADQPQMLLLWRQRVADCGFQL